MFRPLIRQASPLFWGTGWPELLAGQSRYDPFPLSSRSRSCVEPCLTMARFTFPSDRESQYAVPAPFSSLRRSSTGVISAYEVHVISYSRYWPVCPLPPIRTRHRGCSRYLTGCGIQFSRGTNYLPTTMPILWQGCTENISLYIFHRQEGVARIFFIFVFIPLLLSRKNEGGGRKHFYPSLLSRLFVWVGLKCPLIYFPSTEVVWAKSPLIYFPSAERVWAKMFFIFVLSPLLLSRKNRGGERNYFCPSLLSRFFIWADRKVPSLYFHWEA